ncbi:hypothetical protein CsSME_00028275 [Camellia sinensis var. sinensis]
MSQVQLLGGAKILDIPVALYRDLALYSDQNLALIEVVDKLH